MNHDTQMFIDNLFKTSKHIKIQNTIESKTVINENKKIVAVQYILPERYKFEESICFRIFKFKQSGQFLTIDVDKKTDIGLLDEYIAGKLFRELN